MPDEPFIHLCQPDGGKSCGACCGIYNDVDGSRNALAARLRWRTEQFRRDVLTAAELPSFSGWVRAREDQSRRFDVIYCCEYVREYFPHLGDLLGETPESCGRRKG